MHIRRTLFFANIIFVQTMKQLYRLDRSLKRIGTKCNCGVLLIIVFLCIVYCLNLHMHLFEKSFQSEFSYPLETDVMKLVSQLKTKRKVDVEPVNVFRHEYIIDSAHKCRNEIGSFEAVRLLLVIKSAVHNFANRRAIRQTWGWEHRFSDVEIRSVFLLGLPAETDGVELQKQIDAEHEKHLDLVQAKFVDSYYNNTIKTMMGLNWTATWCPKAEFVMFVDDDYYVSTKNVLRYLRQPDSYPEYLQKPFMLNDILPEFNFEALQKGTHGEDEDLNDAKLNAVTSESTLFTGFKFARSRPHRIRLSKWFISLAEYPYDRFPPYITAGAYLLSYQTLLTLNFASFYTLPFRFDDIYLGILAKKVNIDPMHNPNFFFYTPSYSATSYKYYIACHGYENPEELIRVWNEQRTLGNA